MENDKVELCTDIDLDDLRKRYAVDVQKKFFSNGLEEIEWKSEKEEVCTDIDLDDLRKRCVFDLHSRFCSGGSEILDWKSEKEASSADFDTNDLGETGIHLHTSSDDLEPDDCKSSNFDTKSGERTVQWESESRKEIDRVQTNSPVLPHSVFVPDDMIREIFLRVPSNTLSRFKSISKSWRDEINGRSFKNAHQALTIQSTRNLCSFHLTDDIMRLIFFKVSVTTLSILRCVCKNWLKIIDASNFKTMYQMRSTESGDNDTDLVMMVDLNYFHADFDWDFYTDVDGSTLTGPVYLSPSEDLFWGTNED